MSVAIWQGFDFTWDNAPHRLNALSSRIEEDHVHHEFTVGRVPDTGTARTWVTHVRADGLTAVHGRSSLTATAVIGRRASAELPVVRVPLLDADGATVVLRGFSLRCTSCRVGLHTQGFGLRLADARVARGGLVFRPEAWVHAANSPDIITTGRGLYSYAFELDWTVLSGPRSQVDFHSARPVIHQHRGQLNAASDPGTVRHTDTTHGVLGVQGLAVAQRWSGRWGRNGRFVRRMQSGVDDLERAGSTATFRPHLHFSNRGPITYPIDVEHRLWTTLVGFRDGEATRRRIETPITTGIGEGGLARARWRS